MEEQKISVVQAFNNLVLCYDQFFSGNKQQHVLMTKSLEAVKEVIDAHLATQAPPAPQEVENGSS